LRATFLGHAGLYVETEHASILCDPWLSGNAYKGSWWPFPDNDGIDRDAIARPTYLFISHSHPDHCDEPFLLHSVSKDTTVLLPDYPLGSLERQLRRLGFQRFVRTQSGVPFDLDGLRLTIPTMVSPADGPIGDAGLVVEEHGVRLFNQNDSRPTGGLECLGHVDVHFLQFSGAIGYPFLQGYPEKMRVALGRKKRLVSMERARRYVEAVGASHVFPSSGPPCFLSDELFWLNDLGDDDGNVFPDQSQFIRHMAEQGGIRPSWIVPGSVVEITRLGTHITHPMSEERIVDLYSAEGKRRYLDEYRKRKRPIVETIDKSMRYGEVDLVAELRRRWEPLLTSADVICAGVNGRMGIDFDDAPDDALVVDFHERTVRPWQRDDDATYRFTFPLRALVVDTVLAQSENWCTDLLLSFRFREESKGPFNKYLFAFLSALSQERIDYVEDFYRREMNYQHRPDEPFFRMDLGRRRYFVQRRCPHASADLSRFLEYDEDTDTLTCTLHGWQWRPDGTCLTADGHPLYVRPADATLQCADCTYRLRPPAWAEARRPTIERTDATISMPGD
jgi:UDP-MurNAc hydroxylase